MRTAKNIIKLTDIVVSVAAGLILLFSAYGGSFDPRQWVLPSVAVMLFPGLLLFYLLLTAVNIFVSRVSLAINALFIILCLKAILTICPLNFGSSPDKDSDFTLMTYNVFSLKDFMTQGQTPSDNPTLKFILESGTDIVALQECYSLNSTLDGSNISHSLRDSLENKYPYRDFSNNAQALLSVYPFKKVAQNYNDDPTFEYSIYEIHINGDTLTLANIHLQSIGLSPSDKELYMQITEGQTESSGVKAELSNIRRDLLAKLASAFRKRAGQIKKIIDLADELPEPVIVCGDFNDVPLSYACCSLIDAGFQDAYREAGLGPAITYHDNRFYFRIDHIFYKGDIRPEYVRCVKNPTSDHYPLLAGFDFTDQ